MDAAYYYDMCCKHQGKVVRIYDKSGREYCGKIMKVDRHYVWLEPNRPMAGGFGYGWGWGGFWIPVALGAIGGFALASAFFW